MAEPSPPFAMADALLFCGTVESGSFSAAAERHGLTASGVSKAVARLERVLGVRLLVRTTRRLRLTDEGALFFDKCREALALMNQAAQLATETSRSLRGSLRLGVPPALATHVIIPLLREFLGQHPELHVELVRMTQVSEFYALRVDCAIVIGRLDDATLAARELGSGVQATVASPGYLRRRGRPASVADLARHDCLARIGADGARVPWVFLSDEGAAPLQYLPQGRLAAEETAQSVAAALADLGIAQVPLFQVAAEIAAGRLVPVLPERQAPGLSAWIVFAAQRALPRRVRVFVDFIVARSPAQAAPGLQAPGRRPARAARAGGPAAPGARG